MRTLKHLVILLSLAIFIGSCANILGDNKNVLLKIHNGMTKEQVSSILGNPNYRRFDNNTEEWEYEKYLSMSSDVTTIIITFDNNVVSNMNSFDGDIRESRQLPKPVIVERPIVVRPPHGSSAPYGREMKDEEFNAFYSKIKNKPFKDDQLELLQTGAENRFFTCKQCLRLMSIYTFDDDKLEVCRVIIPRIVDRENYDKIVDGVSFISSQEKVRAMFGLPKR